MEQNSYPVFSKLIHKFYLNNYHVSISSFEFDQFINKNKIYNFKLGQLLFITGLARSGTTAVFNSLFRTECFSSLKYDDMPFLLMPITWSKFKISNIEQEVERAHKDGLKVSHNSPEAFDEYFWKARLNNSYIKKESLELHDLKKEDLYDFENYIKAICFSSGKANYLSKNNNNILRIKSLSDYFTNAQFIIMFRSPIEHASSLLNQHLNFEELHKRDSFSLEYFNFLGHFEFGMNHKYFNFKTAKPIYQDKEKINYWLERWLEYYAYILTFENYKFNFVSFEDLCNKPQIVTNYLNTKFMNIFKMDLNEEHVPKEYKAVNIDIELLEYCNNIYTRLLSKREYINHQ